MAFGKRTGGIRLRMPTVPAGFAPHPPAGQMTAQQAFAMAAEVGIQDAEVKAQLKARGFASWGANPVGCLAAIHQMIAEVRANSTGGTGIPDDEIPFAT